MDHRISDNVALGVEMCDDTYRVALLSRHRGRISIKTIYTATPQKEENVNPLYASAPSTLRPLINKAVMVTALEGSEVLIRSLELKLSRPRDIDAVISFEAEPFIPYPIEDAVIEWQPQREVKEGSITTIFAARKEHLENHLHALEKKDIVPEVVSCIPAAIAAFAKHFIPESAINIVNVGWSETTCSLVCDGKLFASFGIRTGTKSFVKALAKDLRISLPDAEKRLYTNVDCSSINENETPKLWATLNAFYKQLLQIVAATNKAAEKIGTGVEDAPLLMTGLGAEIKNLDRSSTSHVDKSLYQLEEQEEAYEGKPLASFAVPLGLALSGTSEESISFRKQEFRYPHPWKHLSRPLIVLASLSLLIALLIFWFGSLWAERHTTLIQENYRTLLAIQDTTPEDFEVLFLKKNPSTKTAGTDFSLKNFSREDIHRRLLFIEKQDKGSPQIFALLPKTARVSDLLAYFSNHPQVVAIDPSTGEKQALIGLQSLTYSMVKRPDATHPREKYRVKVDMEFTAKTPSAARQLHDALIAPNDFVDPKAEVKWSSSRAIYRTSFFLKDKTSYPAISPGGL